MTRDGYRVSVSVNLKGEWQVGHVRNSVATLVGYSVSFVACLFAQDTASLMVSGVRKLDTIDG